MDRMLPERHIVEVFANLLPVGVDETFGVHAGGSVVTGSVAGRGTLLTVGRPAGFVTAAMRGRRSARKIKYWLNKVIYFS